MKKGHLTFIQAIVVLVGIAVFALMLWEPHIEGRNDGATVSQIYFNDPFLVFAYIASMPFFVSLYQGFKILGYAKLKKLYSLDSLKSVRIIKYSALILICFALVGILIIFQNSSDDRAGGVFIGNLIILFSAATAILAAKSEKALQKGLDKKSKKD